MKEVARDTSLGFDIRDWLFELILLLIVITFAFSAPNFLSTGNMFNILRNIAFKGVIALGMTMVIISGEIDLSVGAGVAFFSVLTAFLMKKLLALGIDGSIAIPLAMAAVLCLAYSLGSFSSAIVARLGIPSFITTLAMMQLFKGSALLVSGGFPVIGFPDWYTFFGSGYIGPVPFPAIVFIVVLVIMTFIMKSTPFGRSVYAVGSNKESARISGIDVIKVKRIAFAVTSCFTCLAAFMISAQISCGSPQSGQAWEMDVIAAVIIGGASLSGGAGTIRGTLVGCIFMGVLLYGLTLMNVNEYWQYVVRAVLIFVAVLVNTLIKQRR
ncbi:MAG: ABC transporter permease [Rectinemataceae bacterium]